MGEKMNGLFLEFIIHPGETIKEILEEKQMNQEELAIRTGYSPKHISEVVNGKKGISPSLAKSLEYVLVSEEGPSHDKTFVFEVIIDGIVYGRGTGKSKKEAEQEAARDALNKSVK